MKYIAYSDTKQGSWQCILSLAATVFVSAAIAFAVTGCGSGGGGDSAVAAPGVPSLFDVVKTTVGGPPSATLTWAPPTTGGTPASFEIYRSTTTGTAFLPENHVVSINYVAGQASYTFIDNASLTGKTAYYWIVSAKNAGGETPTAEATVTTEGGPPGGTGDTGYGNNFAAALIFADDIGISGLPITGSWTDALSGVPAIDTNTGLRPTADEVTDLLAMATPVTTLPYLDPNTVFPLNLVDYYKQQTISTWQGQWLKGSETTSPTVQYVNAAWGDNLVSQSLTANSTIRIEMVLTKSPLAAPLTAYTMQSLYGTRESEIQGTDGATYETLTAFVFAANAHLTIQKLDANGVPVGQPLYNQTLWTGDGPGHLAGEVNVSGNFTYGFVWDLKNQDMSTLPGVPKTGTWRITFSLDQNAPPPNDAVINHTNIISASNGTLDNPLQAHIDIVVQ
jgi:hypothetical protein